MRPLLEMHRQRQIMAASRPKPVQKLWRQWRKYFYRRFIHRQGKPEYLARGLAVGVFTGWFPFFGLQIILGVALATLLRGHKLLAVVGTWVSNPITSIPIYWFNFHIGQWLLGFPTLSLEEEQSLSFDNLLNLGTDFMMALLVGSFTVALICAIISYWGSLYFIHRLHQKQFDRRYRKMHSSDYN
ncbi:DUF2062 domain-containing protein [Planktothrix sp. FACHB-1365]|uniref:DUF2062 domain-containing protein n=1 Tax=Planktothrix sp. FACHB-1365 TaxID=2692855 RepID=UPI0016897B11|nr:DUF2062 domain-containing protein [Planktothrix sp. FACHB-1365]MBD2482387.1 DUF2062 domain-containing protein [Planktothrix sp. FACHB-1365]